MQVVLCRMLYIYCKYGPKLCREQKQNLPQKHNVLYSVKPRYLLSDLEM